MKKPSPRRAISVFTRRTSRSDASGMCCIAASTARRASRWASMRAEASTSRRSRSPFSRSAASETAATCDGSPLSPVAERVTERVASAANPCWRGTARASGAAWVISAQAAASAGDRGCRWLKTREERHTADCRTRNATMARRWGGSGPPLSAGRRRLVVTHTRSTDLHGWR
ncbi:unnamed protein product [Chondrus crispus]|uniref:Uncharacterized protein n=1 Tax=Chondrus crispus TaxID=2769 RepID=R7QGU7_CHOCR|nr:unnamed protein product [Chondrus crispus]CDF36640.1 unnamed protein product [Chondrus crispus]|eukprot:XP_005716459.1 unnamed protein product [Chondrus crispus]